MSDRSEELSREPIEVRPLGDLRASGLLWLINRQVFHPRGYALALVINEADESASGWRLIGDGGEVWWFDPDVDLEMFAAAEATLSAARPVQP